MKIGLIDVDSHNFPNLCLMKLSAYHKAKGHMGFDPYVMIYERPTAPPVTRHLQRWVNNKRLFYAVPRFEDYIPGRKEV